MHTAVCIQYAYSSSGHLFYVKTTYACMHVNDCETALVPSLEVVSTWSTSTSPRPKFQMRTQAVLPGNFLSLRVIKRKRIHLSRAPFAFALPCPNSTLSALRMAAQAYQRLSKLDLAREALEAGIEAGKEGGDVMLYVELVQALKQATASRTPAPVATAMSSDDPPASVTRTLDGDGNDNGTNSSSKSVAVEHSTSGSPAPAPAAKPSSSPVRGDDRSGEDRDGDGDGDREGEGGGDDDGSAETAGATGEGEGGLRAAGKKKKKKKKKKKTAKTTWEGEEDASGGRLTLTANKGGGGGLVVEGLSGVLAASDISPVLLEAARAQLCHAVGDPDVDNLIALGYLQVLMGFLGACCRKHDA